MPVKGTNFFCRKRREPLWTFNEKRQELDNLSTTKVIFEEDTVKISSLWSVPESFFLFKLQGFFNDESSFQISSFSRASKVTPQFAVQQFSTLQASSPDRSDSIRAQCHWLLNGQLADRSSTSSWDLHSIWWFRKFEWLISNGRALGSDQAVLSKIIIKRNYSQILQVSNY